MLAAAPVHAAALTAKKADATPRRRSSTPSAGWPLPMLLQSLQNAYTPGDGPLQRRHRNVLSALSARLPHKSAQGYATLPQLAGSASYCVAWTAHALREMENGGYVEWHRGGIVDGKPRPSWFRVNKQALVELLPALRARYRQVVRARAEATAERLAKLPRFLRAKRPGEQHRRRSVHAKVGQPLLPFGEVSGASPAGVGSPDGLYERTKAVLHRRRRDGWLAGRDQEPNGGAPRPARTGRANP